MSEVESNARRAIGSSGQAGCVLTRVGFQKAVGAPEVLRVLDHGDLGHANDHGIGAHLRGGRRVAAVGDVVKRRGRIVVVADHGGRSW